MRMTTILSPRYKKENGPIKLSNYHSVPAIEAFGTWEVRDIVSKSTRVRLAVFANVLEKQERSKKFSTK